MNASPNVTPIRQGVVQKAAQPDLFQIESCEDFDYDPTADTYLISDLLPGSGLGVIYGASRSFKSFVSLDIALRVSQGWVWGGRRSEKTTLCYIVAEGRAGMRKRRAGWFKANPTATAKGAGYFISAAPNLGAEKGDLEKLIESITAAVSGLDSSLSTRWRKRSAAQMRTAPGWRCSRRTSPPLPHTSTHSSS